MTDPATSQFRRATPVLRCADYPRARTFYRDLLGFRVLEEGGDPPRFGILEQGRAVIFLEAWHGPPAPDRSGGWAAYLHVQGVDALARSFDAAGVTIDKPPHDTVYGMREVEILDPDGNRLCFGEDNDPSTP